MPADVVSEVESFQTLEQVMHWSFTRKPPAKLQVVVTQDEFTHDVVIRVTPEEFLVFDTN